MTFEEARTAVLALLRQTGKAKNSEMLALIGMDAALLERVREDLLFEELAEDVRGAGLRLTGQPASGTSDKDSARGPVKLFLSYGRHDASALAERLERDLQARGYAVWRDTRQIKSGTDWQEEITDGLRSAQIVIALMTPHSTRTTRDVSSRDQLDSVCLGELAYALFNPPPQPVVPVMAQSCEPPLAIFHLDYVDMRRWEESEEQYRTGLERLLEGIAAAQRGEKRYRSWHHLLHPFDFAAFLHARREGFTGRRWLFEAIDVWRQSARQDRALLIKGDPGTGKSAVVAELVHRNPGGQVLAYHCCQWDTAQTLEPWRFVQSVAAMIAGKLEDYAAQMADPNIREILGEASCREDPASAFERGVLTPLQHLHAPEGGPRYLLVDALDEALLVPPGQPDLVSLLAPRLDRLPPWLRLVATTRQEPAVLERLAALRAEEIEAQSEDNLTDLRAYIHGRLETAALVEQVREAKQTAADLTARLVEKSEGNFLYARQALDGVVAGIHSLTALDALPPGLRGLYADRFVRLFPDEASFAPARSVLAVICAAREPLGRELIAEASELDVEMALPRVLLRLAAYLPRHIVADGQAAYAVFHKSLADWLTDPKRAGQLHHVPIREGQRRLAEACWQHYQRGASAMPAYALTHLIGHLLEAQRWENGETALLDLSYLEARVCAGQAFLLVEDFSAATAALPMDRAELPRLHLLEEALRRDLHFIARHSHDYPQALFQSLWNSAWWHDCPEAESHYRTPEGGWKHAPPWRNPGAAFQLCTLLERWRSERERRQAGFPWVRTLRPPYAALGAGQLAVMRGHEEFVTSVAFSPDGPRLASASADKTVRIWDAQNGRELLVLKGHQEVVNSVAFSPDGRRLASGARDKTVRLWDVHNGRELLVLEGHERWVTGVAFSPDGRLASGSADKTVRLWDAHNGRELLVLQGHEDQVWSVAFSPDGRCVASGSDDKTVRLWDAQNGRELLVLKGHAERVTSVAFSPDGRHVASGSWDKTVRLWDAHNGRELLVLMGHEYGVNSVAFSPDGRHLVSGSCDKTVRLWDTQNGRELLVLKGHEWNVTNVAFSPDGRRLASGSDDKTVRIWDAHNGRKLLILKGDEDLVTKLAFSPDGRRLASGSDDKTVRIWDAHNGRELLVLQGHENIVESVAFSPDGRRLASGSNDKTVRIWDAQNGRELLVLKGHEAHVTNVAFSPDGRRLASGSDDHTVRIWDAQNGRELLVLKGHEARVRNVVFSPDGRRLASGSDDKTVRLWDAQNGRELLVLEGHARWVMGVAFSPDGRRLAGGTSDKTVRLWDAQNGRGLLVLEGHEHWVTGVAFSPDGRRLVSDSNGETVRLWDAQTGECLDVIKGNGDVRAIAAGDAAFPWRALARDGEIVLELASDGAPVARFSDALKYITTHPEGRIWAGAVGNHLVLFCLEGG